jgi:FkbM family methyltransferase
MTFGLIDFQSDPDVIWSHFRTLTGFVAFDIGANHGGTARLLATGFHTVHAYEPASESYEHLVSGLPENVNPWLLAVSATVDGVNLDTRTKAIGLGELTTGESPLMDAWGSKSTEGRYVPSTTIDAETAKHGAPDFIKIDTEGHERLVVEGGLTTIREHNPRLLIEVHTAENGEWIRDELGGRFTRVAHPDYPPGSELERSHYWLLRGL